jgi:6-phosphofructokinase 1
MSLKRIGVMTSGGDAPGMNAAIRATVRCATAHGFETVGIRYGYRGLMNADFIPLDNRAVGGIMLRGGTMLGTARAPQFATPEGRKQALDHLRQNEIGALVVVGGNGSQSGALSLHQDGFPTVGVASTIDNDLGLVDTCIGVDTALNTALSLVDRLRDTASSHHRAFVVEVMGRNSGYLALMVGISSGAELICTPESPVSLEQVVQIVRTAHQIGKSHFLVIVAEGNPVKAADISQTLNEDGCFESRLSILGHVQRGGAPLAFDRLLGSRSASIAVNALVEGKSGVLAGIVNGDIGLVQTSDAIQPTKKVTTELLQLGEVLSR